MLWVTRCKSLHCRVAYGVRPSARNETLSKSIRLVSIPVHQLDFNFCRSSGPGGQNVNKVNTKAELRFNVHEADWLPEDVRGRLLHLEASRINNAGELVITSQEQRTQIRNREICIAKLKEMVAAAEVEPKERVIRVGIGEKGKQDRKIIKEKRTQIKSSRGSNKGDGY